MNIPRPIGFWYYEYGGQDTLPHPQNLVSPGWISTKEKKKLVSYLKQGAIYETWRGWSHCRFKCGVIMEKMGHSDLTDGVWVWPEGLYHYVEKHDVLLPLEFVAYCRAQGWKIPPHAVHRIGQTHALDHSFWISWANEHRISAKQEGKGVEPAT